AFGKEEVEEMITKYEGRKLLADHDESELNIVQCVFCGSEDVLNVDLDIELHPNVKRVISINFKVRGAKCSSCGETYYDSATTELIRKIKKLVKNAEKES